MDETARAALLISQCVCALVELAAMQATNAARARQDQAQAYPEESFMELIGKYGIDYHVAIGMLQGRR